LAASTVGTLLSLGLIALLAWIVVRAVQRPGDRPFEPAHDVEQDTAERLLADRFPRGETVSAVPRAADVAVRTVVTAVPAADELLSRFRDADLLVVGSRGRAGSAARRWARSPRPDAPPGRRAAEGLRSRPGP